MESKVRFFFGVSCDASSKSDQHASPNKIPLHKRKNSGRLKLCGSREDLSKMDMSVACLTWLLREGNLSPPHPEITIDRIKPAMTGVIDRHCPLSTAWNTARFSREGGLC